MLNVARNDKQEQAQVKAQYLEMLAREVYPNSQKMIEYNRKEIARVVKLSNGDLLPIFKPSIETRFCFGYSDFGQGMERDDAEDLRDRCAKSESFFLSENLKKAFWWLDFMKAHPGEIYTRPQYWKAPADTKLKALEHCDDWKFMNLNERQKAELCKLNSDDVQTLINAYELEKAIFEKRLHAYLKKYGMSKLKMWTYWIDE